MRARELALGSVPCLALRITYVGELGLEIYCPTRVRRRALGRALGGRRAARPAAARLPRDRLDAAREGLPGLGLGHHARDHARRGRARLRGARARQAGAVHRRRTRCAPSARPADRPRSSCCLVLGDPRSVCLGSEPVRFEGEVLRPRHERRLRAPRREEHRARLRCPPAAPPWARAVRSRSSASGSRAEVAAEPLYDPEGARIRS